MATVMEVSKAASNGVNSIPRNLRRKVEELLLQNFAFMDSPVFMQKDIERELFSFEVEPSLPMTSWYQPTRDEPSDQASTSAPQLMKGAEEKIMFLRFNYAKMRLQKLQKLIAKD